MRLDLSPIAGVVLIALDPRRDERGFLARAFSRDEMTAAGLLDTIVDVNVSFNPTEGTLRGMHYQATPSPDPKIVRCTAGAIFDVAIDLRRESSTYLGWFGSALTAENRLAMHVPAGCAHGFITLEPATEVSYLMGERYIPELARGVRWDDPAFGVEWPRQPVLISERDASYPDHVP